MPYLHHILTITFAFMIKYHFCFYGTVGRYKTDAIKLRLSRPPIHSFESEDELRRIIKTMPGIVVLQFSATWCETCKHVKKFYEDLAEEYSHHATFYRTHDEDIAIAFDIQTLPAFKMFINGIEIGGINSIDDLKYRLVQATS